MEQKQASPKRKRGLAGFLLSLARGEIWALPILVIVLIGQSWRRQKELAAAAKYAELEGRNNH